jgi:hypothetical protein
MPAREFAAAVIAPMLLAAACSAFLFSATKSRAQSPSSVCEDAVGPAVLASPIAPWTGAPLRVIFAVEKAFDGEFSLITPDGSIAAKSRERDGGPPYFWFAEVASPAAGTWHATLTRDGSPSSCGTITREIVVEDHEPPRPHATEHSVWPLRNTWNRATENLYSAWIEKLFDAPLDATLSWRALHEVLRDRSRNVLFNYLGLGEDEMGIIFHPDCADLPYFLRAYFAFKMGLPFGYSKCSRGSSSGPPKCPVWSNIENLEPPSSPEPRPLPTEQEAADRTRLQMRVHPAGHDLEPTPNIAIVSSARSPGPAARSSGLATSFAHYLPIVADAVHSGSGRTAATDDNTDYYPVPLTQETLRPGVVYADPYGHVLVLARRVAEADGSAGVFFAVDAQPDGTVARKRFWRGNFLFARDSGLGSPGFKRFRPIVRERNGRLRRLTNSEIAKNPEYGDYSLEQSRLGIEDFYDRMEDVMSPEPLDPFRALQEAITALEEQVKARVTSVENGRKFQNTGHEDVAMPEGASIFETTGAWEDFATPARDLRLLIAIDVVRGFPDRVERRPERYAMPKEKNVAEVKTELRSVLASGLSVRKFSYTRSDGSAWTLTLKDVVDRAPALEMAYNLNDCVELRWGAPERSDEASTCRRHASLAQHAKMSGYRSWFHERRRPPRA